MKVTVLTIFERLFSGEAKVVILPAQEGEDAVLDFHQPFLMKLVDGFIRVFPRDSPDRQSIRIRKGVARMLNNEILIIAET
jgi:F-type H+-transporting ATPase subunit epsilon